MDAPRYTLCICYQLRTMNSAGSLSYIAPDTPDRMPPDRTPECSARVRPVLDQIADKWAVMILTVICPKPARFNEIRRRLGCITHKSLADSLKRLERNGLVTRTVLPTSPVGVEYAITPLGHSLRTIGPSCTNPPWRTRGTPTTRYVTLDNRRLHFARQRRGSVDEESTKHDRSALPRASGPGGSRRGWLVRRKPSSIHLILLKNVIKGRSAIIMH